MKGTPPVPLHLVKGKPSPLRVDIAGQRFGKLVAVEPVARDQWKNIVWLCRCDCGEPVRVVAAALLRPKSRSCGGGSCCNRGWVKSGQWTSARAAKPRPHGVDGRFCKWEPRSLHKTGPATVALAQKSKGPAVASSEASTEQTREG